MELDELLAVEGVEEIKQQDEVKIDVGEREEIKPEIASRPPVFMQKMRETIQSVKEYSWSRGEMGGLDWGIEQFNEAFEGLNTGVHLIGGQSNVGS
ncbi:hypothetical protein KLEB273_gp069 [Bacillus phage vB_BauM_KLEB27-3]|nr:hypothetical protein KLEB273_gp069 [Bacillus phage vB_BauM_KLEB27-3]